MSLLKVIFILILIWYVIKLIVRYVIPKAIFHFLNKQQNTEGSAKKRKTSKEGEINIKMEHPHKSKKEEDNFGEYIDFEEIKPEKKQKDEE